MARWRRGIGQGLLALAVSALLANCGSGGGGGGGVIVRLFFGINNDGACKSVTVDVDLEAAGAVLNTKGGDLDCALNSALDSAGCDVSFQQLDGGAVLRATISGCTIPASTNLFQCGFTDVDLSQLRDESSAQCSCKKAGCDTTPPLCISEDVDPGSCENCSNGKDDDDNGLVDCADPNCEYANVCEGTTTTTMGGQTTTTLGGTTTTTLGTTTTTIPGGGQDCTIVWRLASDVTAGSLQWDTDYGDAPGQMRGTGAQVECSSLVSGALAAFQDNDAGKTLSSGLISLSGIDGPTDLAVCKFDGTALPAIDDFAISVTEASTPDLDEIDPLPSIVIGSLDCISVTTTTLPGETTTTLPGGTTTTTVSGQTTTTLGGVTTTTLSGPTGQVGVGMTSSSAPVGALQFTIDYGDAAGEFVGEGAAVACTPKLAGSLFAPNDKDAQRKLTLGVISLDAFSGPVDLVTCDFLPADPENPPSQGDFKVTVDDATDANGANVTVTLAVQVNFVH